MFEPDTIDVATPARTARALAFCVAIVDRAGHFLQLDQPDVVGRRIAEFIGQAS